MATPSQSAPPDTPDVPGRAARRPAFGMRRGRSEQTATRSLLVPVVVFVVTRSYLFVLARAAPAVLSPLHRYPIYLPRTDPLARFWTWTSPWFRFDARWYVNVAEHGYRYGSIDVTNTNFFPLYPVLIRMFQPIALGSPWLSAWFISNAAFLAALIALWRWALLRWRPEVALRVLLLVSCFPFAFFFAAPYAEPLFLACAVAAFWLADRGQWGWAAALGGLSAIARPVGVAVVVALVILAARRRDTRSAAVAAVSIVPFLAFVLYLWITTGHPLAFTVYHTAGWVPPRGGLVSTVTRQFHTSLSPFDRVDAAVSLLFLLSAVAVWRIYGAAYASFVALGVLLPLARSLAGMERYVIVLFPVPAAWAVWRSPAGQAAIFAISVLLLTGATCMFAVGYSIF